MYLFAAAVWSSIISQPEGEEGALSGVGAFVRSSSVCNLSPVCELRPFLRQGSLPAQAGANCCIYGQGCEDTTDIFELVYLLAPTPCQLYQHLTCGACSLALAAPFLPEKWTRDAGISIPSTFWIWFQCFPSLGNALSPGHDLQAHRLTMHHTNIGL